ncbi:MAG: lysoplasmalogenase [Prolixibacteraceae bacterium]|nr:lysoplasmalogenase [Prolixibacteraceae bacterium]
MYSLLLIPFASALLALNHFGFPFKAGVAASGILILWWVHSGKLSQSKDVWAIFGAFVFSIAGDWFLSNRHGETSRFIMGIALFFLAHVGYLTFTLMNGRLNRLLTLIILAAYLGFYFFMLSPGIEDKTLKVAALFYLLISCFSLGAVLGMKGNSTFRWLYIFGIVLVLFSDTIIALREFAKYEDLDFLILPTYYLAQMSVTASLIVRKLSYKQ